MIYDLDKRGSHPIYEYLYVCIKNDILTGKIAPGEKLPSKRAFAKSQGVSVITVENAYAQLLTEGYIYSEEKRGFFAGDIGGKYIQGKKKRIPVTQPQKEDWLVNFKSNHIRYDNFPFSTWSKVMRQTLADQELSFLESPESQGVAPLRQVIALHLEKYRGLSVNPNNIIVGAGTEYLYGLIVQILGHSSMIAVEDPGHKKIGKVYESNGIRCVRIPVDRYGVKIEELWGSNALAVHISPSHHFPTGIVMPANRRHKLIQWARENETYIIEDDYDSEFRFSGRPIPTLASIDEERVIYMNTFSKTLAPSIRIAYMILPEPLMQVFREKFDFYSSTVSGFEQYTLANFIKQGYYERHINRMRNYYREYRNHILTAIRESRLWEKVTIEEENAGLHFILKIHQEIEDGKYVEKLKKNGINISTVAEYCYNDDGNFKHQFIVNYSAVNEEDLKKALEIMANALEE
ncbi:MAG: PLP-dependent aminotransferase family protein [Eubacterium sp.]|nr:PLP-dependent aminotransferase family protein [Eubacterium sp.]